MNQDEFQLDVAISQYCGEKNPNFKLSHLSNLNTNQIQILLDRYIKTSIGISNLNRKLSNNIDCGGGIESLEKWIECIKIK